MTVLFYDFDHGQKFHEFVIGDYASRGSGRILGCVAKRRRRWKKGGISPEMVRLGGDTKQMIDQLNLH